MKFDASKSDSCCGGKMIAELARTEEVTERDIAVIEVILKQIDHKNTTRERLTYWKLAMKLFKHFDLGYTCLPDRSPFEKHHKEILQAMIAVTDWVVEQSRCLDQRELSELNLSTDALKAGLQFLRRKFSQWYIPCDEAVLSRTATAIEHGQRSAP
jgi:hypothetical protein